MWVISLGSRWAPALGSLALLLSLGACCPPVIFTETLPPGRVGDPYHFAFEGDCWTAFWWMTGELPVGMSFDSEGVLKGTPRYAGVYFLTVGWDDVVDGELLTSVSKSFELLIVEEGEPLPEREESTGAFEAQP